MCNTPAETGLLRQDLPVGHAQWGKLVRCTHSFHNEIVKKKLMAISQMGEQDIKRKLSDIAINNMNRSMILGAKRIIEQGYGWLYIWGGPGNAKSEALKAVVNQFNKNGRGPAMYTLLGSILDYMKLSFNEKNDLSYYEEFERLKKIKILAIDEMDKPNQSDWMEDFRFHFLDARYVSAVNRETITLFAGNQNPESYGDVLYDRIRDGRFEIAHNTAPSARPEMSWED